VGCEGWLELEAERSLVVSVRGSPKKGEKRGARESGLAPPGGSSTTQCDVKHIVGAEGIVTPKVPTCSGRLPREERERPARREKEKTSGICPALSEGERQWRGELHHELRLDSRPSRMKNR